MEFLSSPVALAVAGVVVVAAVAAGFVVRRRRGPLRAGESDAQAVIRELAADRSKRNRGSIRGAAGDGRTAYDAGHGSDSGGGV